MNCANYKYTERKIKGYYAAVCLTHPLSVKQTTNRQTKAPVFSMYIHKINQSIISYLFNKYLLQIVKSANNWSYCNIDCYYSTKRMNECVTLFGTSSFLPTLIVKLISSVSVNRQIDEKF